MSEEQPMRKVIFAINITIDGYCGHETGIVDDELHEYFTWLLRESGVDIFGRNTYHLMYPSILARCRREWIGNGSG